MVVRKSRKSRKKRGSRTVGGGGSSKRRHSGHRGGKGLAGSHKHRWRKILERAPGHFGKRGFKRPQAVQRSVGTINVGELDERADELVRDEVAKREGEKLVIDVSELGFDKVLGGGQVTRPMRVIADEFSGSAKRKLERAGGEAVSGES